MMRNFSIFSLAYFILLSVEKFRISVDGKIK